MRLFAHGRTAGLACCHGQITLVCLLHDRHRIGRLEALAEAPLPDTPEQMTETIRQMVAQTQSRGWPAAIALPLDKVIRREVFMASGQSSAERERDLREHLADYLPGCPSIVCLDHIQLRRDKNTEHILLVAAEEIIIHTAVTPAENAGLVVRIVDIEDYAKARALALKTLHDLPCADTVNKNRLLHPTPSFLTALGLALRRCPVW